MARIAAVIESPPADLLPPNIRATRRDPGDRPPPNGDELMQQILASLRAMPREDVLRRIASLPRARQNVVLAIRRKLTEGTYEARDQLNEAMDRVLDVIVD